MGYSAWQRLVRIELPLALPLIVAGIRIAVVTVIGIATVAAFIDAGGFSGTIIRTWQNSDQSYTEKILVGGLLTALLATFFDLGVEQHREGAAALAKARPLSEMISWIVSHQPEFYRALGQHLLMCGVSMTIALALGLPLAVLIVNRGGLAFGVINSVSALRALPSLAILAIMMPILGIGLWPSIVALTVLALPPILLNAYVGLRDVDPGTPWRRPSAWAVQPWTGLAQDPYRASLRHLPCSPAPARPRCRFWPAPPSLPSSAAAGSATSS